MPGLTYGEVPIVTDFDNGNRQLPFFFPSQEHAFALPARIGNNFILRAEFAAKSCRIRLSAAELPDMMFCADGPKISNKPYTSSAAAAPTSAWAAASADGNACPPGTERTVPMDNAPAKASPLSTNLNPTVPFSSLCRPLTLTLLRLHWMGQTVMVIHNINTWSNPLTHPNQSLSSEAHPNE
jgi:hypothetical protein